MIPVFYELKRALTSKTVIILTVVIILFSVAAAYGTAAVTNPGGPSAQNVIANSFAYDENGTINVSIHLATSYGDPIVNSTVNVSFPNGYALPSKTTDSHGYANFTANNVNNTTFSISNGINYGTGDFNYTNSLGSTSFQNTLFIFGNQSFNNPYFYKMGIGLTTKSGNSSKNTTLNVSRYSLNTVRIQNEATKAGLNIYYNGNLGTTSPAVKLYYMPVNASTNLNYKAILENATSEKNMSYYGTYSNFNSINVDPANLTGSANNQYLFALFAPNGTPVTPPDYFYPAALYGPHLEVISTTATSSQVNSAFFGSEMSLLGLFVPLMAAVSAYMTYGKDRTGQVLESVLVRPVSRRGLIATRYLANTSAVFIAAVISLAVSSLMFDHYLGKYLPLDTFLYGLWAVFIGIAGFIGLVYLASNFLKSQGALLGFAIALFFVFDLFWSFLPLIPELISFELLKLTSGTLPYAHFMVDMTYVTPTGFTTIANYLVSGGTNLAYNVQGVTLAQQGVTPLALIITGLVWIAVPLAVAIYAYSRRD